MMSDLLQMLAATSDPLHAKQAEQMLEQAAATTPGFGVALLSVVVADANVAADAQQHQQPVHLRQTAALLLRTLVIRPHWSMDSDSFKPPLVCFCFVKKKEGEKDAVFSFCIWNVSVSLS